jgi:hypothetical protein
MANAILVLGSRSNNTRLRIDFGIDSAKFLNIEARSARLPLRRIDLRLIATAFSLYLALHRPSRILGFSLVEIPQTITSKPDSPQKRRGISYRSRGRTPGMFSHLDRWSKTLAEQHPVTLKANTTA